MGTRIKNEEDCVHVQNKLGRIVKVGKIQADHLVKYDSAKIVEVKKELKEMTKKELLIEGINKGVTLDPKATNKELIEILSK